MSAYQDGLKEQASGYQLPQETISWREFNFWFEGFQASFKYGAPSTLQLREIKNKLDQVRGDDLINVNVGSAEVVGTPYSATGRNTF